MGVSFYRTNGTNEHERFLLDKLLVIVGNYCPSKHRRCNKDVLCVKTFYLNFFVRKVCLNGNMLYLCKRDNKASVLDVKLTYHRGTP